MFSEHNGHLCLLNFFFFRMLTIDGVPTLSDLWSDFLAARSPIVGYWKDTMSPKDEWDPSAISNYGDLPTDNHTTWFGFYPMISYFIE